VQQRIKLLTADCLEEFRSIVLSTHETKFPRFETLVHECKLETYESQYTLETNVMLLKSDKNLDNKELDKQNSLTFSSALGGVTWQSLRDESLWVSLAFGYFYDYVISRWGDFTDTEARKKTLTLHWFTSTSRSLWRDHAISRLWWMGSYCSDLQSISKDKALDVIFIDSDFANSFFGRPVTISSKRLAETVLNRFYSHFFETKSADFDRHKFRTFMKQLDLMSGAIFIDAVSQKDLELLVDRLFSEVYEGLRK